MFHLLIQVLSNVPLTVIIAILFMVLSASGASGASAATGASGHAEDSGTELTWSFYSDNRALLAMALVALVLSSFAIVLLVLRSAFRDRHRHGELSLLPFARCVQSVQRRVLKVSSLLS